MWRGVKEHPLRATSQQTDRNAVSETEPLGHPFFPSVPILASLHLDLLELFYSALFSMTFYQSLGLFFGGIFGFILLKEV